MQIPNKNSFNPLFFAFVMATGVISTALEMAHYALLSKIFFVLDIVGYGYLIALALFRLIGTPKLFLQEFTNPLELFKWFTFSAGTNILATRFILASEHTVGFVLGVIGALSAFVLVYACFFLLLRSSELLQAISPLWLLQSIACHSVGIVVTALWAERALTNPLYLLIGLGFWSFGFFMYLLFMALNIYRVFFLPFTETDPNPAFWTYMGAAAIAVVDGSYFITLEHVPLFVEAIKPYLSGMVFLLWTWGTAWIPILVIMMIWKYSATKLPIRFEPSLWAMVFPLGMYTVATDAIAESLHLDMLTTTVPHWLWISILAWLMTAALSRFRPQTG
jgi:tellurite resistance protein TehA-like permease